MKTVASLSFGLASAIAGCIAAASVASYVIAEPEHTGLSTQVKPDLWPSEPRRVDMSKQRYIRLPPALSAMRSKDLSTRPLTQAETFRRGYRQIQQGIKVSLQMEVIAIGAAVITAHMMIRLIPTDPSQERSARACHPQWSHPRQELKV